MVEKITLMDAYLIEYLRKENISDKEIEQIVLGLDADRFQYVNDSFDFKLLHELADRIEVILRSGYEVKFLTFTGLINLLRIKFKKEKEIDFHTNDFVITHLKMTDEVYKSLQQLVSSNWIVTKDPDGISVRPTQ